MYSTPFLASLLPKLRDHYAEFLDPISLVHLRLLALPTCVGLRYGRLQHSLTELFLPADSTSLEFGLPRALALPSRLPYTVGRSIHKTADASFLGPSVVVNTLQAGPEF